ncbi:ABC-2 type transporter [Geobacter metallireducens RCH3]|uniref:ABC transporter, membrane protein n=1 Tax=Geobacter metallireducens (strain ATCC 53774 / DSM 7210 / GS-15) TaxID=269799 RepID=Q39XX7_GEOMG|nr:ABC transporter permease [Geobacter metallireducens]ABB30897.1 ABC transporter, membrane protein [Geobacter metallireducens GS-15]EHP84792.1 ABC-2 type transporter [Geobacter metallireducens RCH3]
MLERLRCMLVKEIIQALRDPRMRFILFIIPAVQTVIFGYAVNTDVRNVTTAVYDLDNSPESRDLVARFQRSGYFLITQRINHESRVRELMDRGEVKAILRINRGFGAGLGGGRTAPLQIILDGTDSNTAGIVLNYASRITARLNDELRGAQLPRSAGARVFAGGVQLQSRAWFNENLESSNYYVPAVIANIVLIITMLLSGMAVVREKEIGTMEQIIVTPISRSEFILGKTIPFVLIGFIDVAVITAVSKFWFQVPIRGSLPLLFGSTALFLMSTLGFGLFISTISTTQQQAMMSSFFFIFPAMLLSGFAFPIENMPRVIQYFTYLNPLRYYLVIIRGIFLKGVGVDILWPQMTGLLVLGSVILGFAVKRFRKTLA